MDCPHWAKAPEEHASWLGAAWRSGSAELAAARDVFLPEDFRELRRRRRARGVIS